MANYTAKASTEAKKEWKTILVPSNKLSFIYNGNGKVALAFLVPDDDSVSFMVSSKLVKVNKDRTGFEVSLPCDPVRLSKAVKDGDNWKREELLAPTIEDLGYPVVE